jgi:Gas vesicle synthesis protein GvpO
MAEQKSNSKRNGSSSSKLSAREAIQRVREELPELMGKPIETILGVEQGDDGWEVTAQVLELARIPNSTDVLGIYAVSLDTNGELAGYRRRRRYNRSQAAED